MVTGTPPAPGANVVLNPGFEAGNNGDWDVTGTLISANATPFFFPHAGRWFAFMQGYGTNTDDPLTQAITVPDSPTAMLRFSILVNTSEQLGVADDVLQVRIDSDVVATYDNTQANNSYTQKTISLAGYAGDGVTLGFFGNENATRQTKFLLDDIRVTPS